MSANAPKLPASAPGWKVEDSAELYQVDAWGGGYFAVNPAGQVVLQKAAASQTARKSRAKQDRFAAARGKADVQWRTKDLMALLRG